jgi:hypothetical protein
MAVARRNDMLRTGKARRTKTRHLRRLTQVKTPGFTGTAFHTGHNGIDHNMIARLYIRHIATHFGNAGSNFVPRHDGVWRRDARLSTHANPSRKSQRMPEQCGPREA